MTTTTDTTDWLLPVFVGGSVEMNTINSALYHKTRRLGTCMTMSHGETCLTAIRAGCGEFRVIFVDYNLPDAGMNGLNFAKRVRDLGINVTIVIICSPEERDKVQACANTALSRDPKVLVYPFSLDGLFRDVARLTSVSLGPK